LAGYPWSTSKAPSHSSMIAPQAVILAVCHNYLMSIALMDAVENGTPRSFMMPRCASSPPQRPETRIEVGGCYRREETRYAYSRGNSGPPAPIPRTDHRPEPPGQPSISSSRPTSHREHVPSWEGEALQEAVNGLRGTAGALGTNRPRWSCRIR
jgi:hypothetical protein